MPQTAPQTTYLKDYTSYPYIIHNVTLTFYIHEGYTDVRSVLDIQRATDHTGEDLYLHGEALDLRSLSIDGTEITDARIDEAGLSLPCPEANRFTLSIVTRIAPEDNTRLEGLYRSGGTYCTQCEAEGFRRITYYPDRPDVMSIFTVRIEADRVACPVLLSNGNLTDSGDLGGGRHYAVWHDPHKKPCYLFALVAADLKCVSDAFTTRSGREVDLHIYVRAEDQAQCGHAMDSLKRSMAWDEEVYGLEYDLDIFNIVAVSDFNMGAMENKSLNIFNTALVLAHSDTATDQDFIRVESVIAHEYFHNWSGNRVTCRDWFQLSLKEGLTVFRDQEFSADMHARSVQRIDDVTHLRRHQFPEDAGPLAHCIRPKSYIEINNFYTMTVYEKGAEIIRMLHTLLGAKAYRAGTDLYFTRHDGQAATCEDFVRCMEDASGRDLSQFRLWYSQAGTPSVRFEGRYDAKGKRYHVTLSQQTPATPGQPHKKPMHMPISLGLLARDGQEMIGTQVLELTEAMQDFTIEAVNAEPVPSILRGFSAPVRLQASLTDADLAHLSQHDTDGFNRWEAGQILANRALQPMIDTAETGGKPAAPQDYVDGLSALIEAGFEVKTDTALLARALTLPSTAELIQTRDTANPEAIHTAREALRAAIKRTHKVALAKLYTHLTPQDHSFSVDHKAMGRRALRNVTLDLLTATKGTGCAKRALAHYESATCMTDRVAALSALAGNKNSERERAFDDFYDRFKGYPLVMDKWFALQASAPRPDLIEQLERLRSHPDFTLKNPNRVRALYTGFSTNNPQGFHKADGSGYVFVCKAIIALNAINPQIGARLLTPFRQWRHFSSDRQAMMQDALQIILATPDLAPDIFEIASKSLEDA